MTSLQTEVTPHVAAEVEIVSIEETDKKIENKETQR